ncbi:MAG: hypothetical protein ACYTFK_00755 [Planctomycetota bacterium]|jgi:predicted membrane channel-forming protein YqfA (hemolysin III family)
MNKKQMTTTYVCFGFMLIVGIATEFFGVNSIDVTWCIPAGIIMAVLFYVFKGKSKPKEKKGAKE